MNQRLNEERIYNLEKKVSLMIKFLNLSLEENSLHELKNILQELNLEPGGSNEKEI